MDGGLDWWWDGDQCILCLFFLVRATSNLWVDACITATRRRVNLRNTRARVRFLNGLNQYLILMATRTMRLTTLFKGAFRTRALALLSVFRVGRPVNQGFHTILFAIMRVKVNLGAMRLTARVICRRVAHRKVRGASGYNLTGRVTGFRSTRGHVLCSVLYRFHVVRAADCVIYWSYAISFVRLNGRSRFFYYAWDIRRCVDFGFFRCFN